MEFENLVQLMETFSASSLTEFKYEENGVKLDLKKKQEQAPQSFPDARQPRIQEAADCKVASGDAVGIADGKGEKSGHYIESPLVGVFYTAPSEDAKNFVSVGDTVKKGQVLAIVEAMKLMNEIESEYDGVVAEVLAENAQTVEYGQPLFRIV